MCGCVCMLPPRRYLWTLRIIGAPESNGTMQTQTNKSFYLCQTVHSVTSRGIAVLVQVQDNLYVFIESNIKQTLWALVLREAYQMFVISHLVAAKREATTHKNQIKFS